MKLSREVKTAILVILGIVFLIFGFNYLKGENLLNTSNKYYTEFDYNALSTASPVTIKGNPVGKIINIVYNMESGKTRVEFTVDNQLEFSKNSRIRLYEVGLMEGNGMAIIPANDNEFAKDGDVLTSEVEPGLVKSLTSNFSGLSSGLDTTLKSADSLLVGLTAIVQDESDEGLQNAIKELNGTIKSFNTLSAGFNRLLAKNEDSLTIIIKNFTKVSNDLATLSEDLKDVKFSQTVASLDQTLGNVDKLVSGIERGDGTLGKLMKDDKLYNNLEIATAQLRELLQDIKLNPKRYVNVSVFGGKNKDDYEKPEDERE